VNHKILRLGAIGHAGRLVIEEALAEGHPVVAPVRRPEALAVQTTGLTVIGGNPWSAEDVQPGP